MEKDKILKKLNKCKVKDENKIKELVEEYIENEYPLVDLLLSKNESLNSVAKGAIKNDKTLCILLNCYSVSDLGVVSYISNLDLLKKYIECLCFGGFYDRMYDIINKFSFFDVDATYFGKFSISQLYSLYKEHKNNNYLVSKISVAIVLKSTEELFELNDMLNKDSESGKLKNTILLALYKNSQLEKVIEKFNYDDKIWYVERIISTEDIKRAYEFYKLTNVNEIKLRLFELIKEKDTGKYIYLLLTQNKLSKKQKEQLEEMLENCTDKQYKYFYLFYLNKKEIINIFVSYSAFMLFISTFSDKDEIQKIKVALEDALAQESENFEDSLSIVKTPVNNNVKRMK